MQLLIEVRARTFLNTSKWNTKLYLHGLIQNNIKADSDNRSGLPALTCSPHMHTNNIRKAKHAINEPYILRQLLLVWASLDRYVRDLTTLEGRSDNINNTVVVLEVR